MEQVAKSRPDGYTLGMATMSTHGSNAAAYGTRLKYDPVKDFAPVSNVATVPSVLAVNAKFPARTMAELLAMARKEPGKITFASPGMGSLGHANVEYFSSLAKIELLHVPYKGSGMALNDAVAGQVDAITDNLPSALTHIQAGRLRALAVLSDKRSPALPDVPTYGELGFPQMGNGGWFGIVAPAGTPAPVVRRLNPGHPCGHEAAGLHQEDGGRGCHPHPQHAATVPDPDRAGRGALRRRGQGRQDQRGGEMKMQDTLQDQALFVLHPPEGAAIPLVCDSPHSGVRYPGDFGHAVPRSVLRAAEDTHVEALWGAAPAVGATLVEALVPAQLPGPEPHARRHRPGPAGHAPGPRRCRPGRRRASARA